MLGLLLVPAGARAADFAAPRVYGETGGGILRFPQAIAYDASGVSDPAGPAGPYVYVADQYSFLVQKFTTGGTFVRQWGGYGSDAGHFGATSPNGAATGTTGVVGGIGGLAVVAPLDKSSCTKKSRLPGRRREPLASFARGQSEGNTLALSAPGPRICLGDDAAERSGRVRPRVLRGPLSSPVETRSPRTIRSMRNITDPKKAGPFPCVIVLDVAGGDQTLSRIISRNLAQNGIAGLFVQMAYYERVARQRQGPPHVHGHQPDSGRRAAATGSGRRTMPFPHRMSCRHPSCDGRGPSPAGRGPERWRTFLDRPGMLPQAALDDRRKEREDVDLEGHQDAPSVAGFPRAIRRLFRRRGARARSSGAPRSWREIWRSRASALTTISPRRGEKTPMKRDPQGDRKATGPPATSNTSVSATQYTSRTVPSSAPSTPATADPTTSCQ